jgi:hypothetical protein
VLLASIDASQLTSFVACHSLTFCNLQSCSAALFPHEDRSMENEISPAVMIHTTTGKVLSVDYWAFREILSEAERTLKRDDPEHAALCKKITEHLTETMFD